MCAPWHAHGELGGAKTSSSTAAAVASATDQLINRLVDDIGAAGVAVLAAATGGRFLDALRGIEENAHRIARSTASAHSLKDRILSAGDGDGDGGGDGDFAWI
ncbi:hypothetical protein ACP4OV_006586 [Aristida adscensionis]